MIKKKVLSLDEKYAIIMKMICEGESSVKIGEAVELSEHTVNNYIKALAIAYGAKNRVQLAVNYTKSIK